MPAGARWKSARLEDEELAAKLVESGADLTSTQNGPDFTEWTAIRSDLADIKDLLNMSIAVTARSEQAPAPVPRPVPAISKYLEKKSSEKLSQIVHTLLGGSDG